MNNKRDYCEACNMIRNGVKSRIALEHTCGLERGAIPDFETEKDAVKKPKPKPKPRY